MWTCTITVKDTDGTPVELVLAKDLSPNIIQKVMKEPLHILMTTGNVIRATYAWYSGIAAQIIRAPQEYRDSKKIMNLPWQSSQVLIDKIGEIYPFYEYVPSEYKEPLHKLGKEWQKIYEDLVEECNEHMDKLRKSS